MATTITKDMIIGDILHIDQGFVPLLMGMGMHCLGCPSSQAETIEDACMVHGEDVDAFVAKLNAFLANKEK